MTVIRDAPSHTTPERNARRTLLQGLAAAAAVTASTTALSSTAAHAATINVRPYLKTRLTSGSKGATVKVLQRALGFRTSLQDSKFGPKTRTAVIAFQRKKRLRATGIVDEATWRALGGLPTIAQEAAAQKKAAADAAARKAKAEAAARAAKAKADEEARLKAEAALNATETGRHTSNKTRRTTLLGKSSPSVHAPGLTLAADPEWHLVRRLTYGATPGLVTAVKKIGGPAWIDQQLNPSTIVDTACDAIVAKTWPHLNASYLDLAAMKNEDGDPAGLWYSHTWLERATETRRIFSQRQVLEMVTEMWHDHLHVNLSSDKVDGLLPSYDRNVIRKHALGSFTAMLQASLTHPAMLCFLDNQWSYQNTPNENLGRELLELHTVGAGRYTEADVKQSALILTGHSIRDNDSAYQFRSNFHYVGPVKVMGFSHANATATAGPDLLSKYVTYLATHPATATRIAEKMCRRFVSDTPSATLIAAVAKVFTDNKTAITPTLLFLFNHAEFKAAHSQKYRRPGEYVTATYRALTPTWVPPTKGTGVLDDGAWVPCQQVHEGHDRLEHTPMGWPAPNGYPDVAPAWQSVGGLVIRANVPHEAVHGYDPTIKPGNLRTAYGITPTMSAYDVVDTLTEKISGYPFQQTHRDALASFLWDTNGPTPPRFLDPVGEARLAARLPELVRLILASPYMNLR